MKRIATLLLTAMAFSAPGEAADNDGNYAVWGVGRSSCHGYNKARESGDYGNYKDYLMGYLTAYNRLATDTYVITGKSNLNEILAWVDDHCQKVAMDSFDRTLQLMVDDFSKDRLRSAPNSKNSAWGH